jgi:hypothetical protein
VGSLKLERMIKMSGTMTKTLCRCRSLDRVWRPGLCLGVFAIIFAFSFALSNEESVSTAGSVFGRHVPVLIEKEVGERCESTGA